MPRGDNRGLGEQDTQCRDDAPAWLGRSRRCLWGQGSSHDTGLSLLECGLVCDSKQTPKPLKALKPVFLSVQWGSGYCLLPRTAVRMKWTSPSKTLSTVCSVTSINGSCHCIVLITTVTLNHHHPSHHHHIAIIITSPSLVNPEHQMQ